MRMLNVLSVLLIFVSYSCGKRQGNSRVESTDPGFPENLSFVFPEDSRPEIEMLTESDRVAAAIASTLRDKYDVGPAEINGEEELGAKFVILAINLVRLDDVDDYEAHLYVNSLENDEDGEVVADWNKDNKFVLRTKVASSDLQASSADSIVELSQPFAEDGKFGYTISPELKAFFYLEKLESGFALVLENATLTFDVVPPRLLGEPYTLSGKIDDSHRVTMHAEERLSQDLEWEVWSEDRSVSAKLTEVRADTMKVAIYKHEDLSIYDNYPKFGSRGEIKRWVHGGNIDRFAAHFDLGVNSGRGHFIRELLNKFDSDKEHVSFNRYPEEEFKCRVDWKVDFAFGDDIEMKMSGHCPPAE